MGPGSPPGIAAGESHPSTAPAAEQESPVLAAKRRSAAPPAPPKGCPSSWALALWTSKKTHKRVWESPHKPTLGQELQEEWEHRSVWALRLDITPDVLGLSPAGFAGHARLSYWSSPESPNKKWSLNLKLDLTRFAVAQDLSLLHTRKSDREMVFSGWSPK